MGLIDQRLPIAFIIGDYVYIVSYKEDSLGSPQHRHIGVKKVIPGMQLGRIHVDRRHCVARSWRRLQEAASALGIPTAYGSYEELLADPNIDAIYNPLPNHLHVPWTIKAAEAGKHVLCEKPISLTVAEAETLLAVRARTGVKIGEAFMVRLPSAVAAAARTAATKAASANCARSSDSSATSTSIRRTSAIRSTRAAAR